jgi:hypothetical protein
MSLSEPPAHARRSNRRVAWSLFALALVFFAGIIVSRLTGNPQKGLMVVGTGVLVFLIAAIGRHLRK